jgi:D-serine deaminase-like pyridoxal phosphate-dependent protein
MIFTLDQLDTPSLTVDMDTMESNMVRMKSFIDSSPLDLRPHTKAHKIPDMARLQLNLGAKGICVAKLGEAEVMVDAGIDDVLITTPIANPIKIARLIALKERHPQSRIIQIVDNAYHVEHISRAANKAGVNVELLIEIECGQKRCGVNPGPELVELIELINRLPNVSYEGLQAYTGHVQHVRDYRDRKKQARDLVQPLFDFIQKRLTTPAMRPKIISGGGTGTYDAYDGLPFTELQAGSYLFMDLDYHTVGSKNGNRIYEDFDCALKVWTTVISKPSPERVVVDAGMKCLSIDSGMPKVENMSDVVYTSGGDEHGILTMPSATTTLEIGERIMIIPSHCDTTLNQFSRIYGIRGNNVETEWEIQGRGRSD